MIRKTFPEIYQELHQRVKNYVWMDERIDNITET
jgi:hypothetical protein